ncbi:MAG: hypothetical protein ACRD2Y_10365 [Terriglobales bacterium]
MSAGAPITLRPMNTGELLDRTITLYRRHFVLFVGIMALPNVFLLGIGTAGALAVFGAQKMEGVAAAGFGLMLFGVVAVGFLAYWLAYVLSLGATTYALSEIYLGRQAGILQSYGVVKSKLLRLVGMTLLLWMALIAGFILCVVPCIWVLLRTAIAIPAAVIEDRPIIDAIERSIALTKGSWVRVLLVYLLAVALNWAAIAMLQYPFEIAAVFAGAEGGAALLLQLFSLAGQVLAGTLTGPILAIALALIYYDERVRKEGFDLQYMMAALDTGAAPAPGAAPGTPPAPPTPPTPPLPPQAPPPPAPIG